MTKEEIITFVDSKLKNINSKLEGQRLRDRWFIKHGHTRELGCFRELGILDSQLLYNYINDVRCECECGKPRRFKSFRDGYTTYCVDCARSEYNHMKRTGNVDKDLNDVVGFVKVNGKYRTSRIKKLSPDTINTVIDRTKYLDESSSVSERLYHIEHGLLDYPVCKLCGNKNRNFRTGIVGYFPYCKGSCSYKIPANLIARKNKHNCFFYSKYIDKYKKIDSKEYEVLVFSYDDYVRKRGDAIVKITHVKCGHQYSRGIDYQGHLKCPKCYPIRSRAQYELFESLNDSNLLFNDRKLLSPKELDILSPEHLFAVEYDSLSYHSYGPHQKKELNNFLENPMAHIDKTEQCEEKGVQLFRVFSNEWLSPVKKPIWVSTINNKMNKSKRLHGRKCTIKEVSSKVANLFLEENHLQGKCNSSVRLGLYNDNELVSLMTFSKSRYNKSVEWELIRFCSKLNLTVVGGASKLLKHFERSYHPTSIVSYANRRWSTGNLYEKLGFEFVKNTKPNYFYFKGGDNSKLLSREQFQKHKLKDKLVNFDPRLTETQNMYNNGYRKIYDCGNKVYIKKGAALAPS